LAKENSKEYLSTGQAATLCSVTPDTVLKWIKSGKLEANRTAGGHYRVHRETLLAMIDKDRESLPAISDRRFHYCWEFYSKSGELPEACTQCLVYRSRAGRCYEISRLQSDDVPAKLFCQKSCDECEYFRVVQGQRPNVLVVTDKSDLEEQLQKKSAGVDYNLRFSDCEYHCSMVVEKFRPDYVVIDCSLGRRRSREFAHNLEQDPRIPYVKVVLAGEPDEIPEECDRSVFAFIRRPFSTEQLSELMTT
jgi:excisionase family DNA binding protein